MPKEVHFKQNISTNSMFIEDLPKWCQDRIMLKKTAIICLYHVGRLIIDIIAYVLLLRSKGKYTNHWYIRVRVMVFNTTFNNISVLLWQSVLLMEETGLPGENHRPAASHWQTLSHNVVSSTPHHEQDSSSQL